MTALNASTPLERSFRLLVNSRRPGSGKVLAFSVLNSTGQPRRLAVRSAVESGESAALDAVVRVFDQLDPDQQSLAVSRGDEFLPVLRRNVRDADKRVRANVCDFLVRMDDARVAYLLADFLQDPSEEIKAAAQEGLLMLAHGYHKLALQVQSGEVEMPRSALETKRYALLDALLTALRFYGSHERPEMIAALLSLDGRGDEVLMDILSNPMDRRRKIILDILETAHYPRAIDFLLSMLKSARTSSLAVDVVETRFDVEFIRALLSKEPLLSNTRVTNALAGVKFLPWLRPGTEKGSQLPGVLGVRAVRLLLYTGTESSEKRLILEKLSQSDKPAVASAARFALAAMERQVQHDRVDAGLRQIEERCPRPETQDWEPRVSELVVDRADGAGQTAEVLSDEALFRNFLNSFESLARSEKEAALDEFESKGILRRELSKALQDREPDTVLRAVKVVEYRGLQGELSSELSALSRHSESRVRASAVRQLGKAGAYDALKALFETLSDRDRRVLANAVEALEESGHRQILRLLEPLMKHPDNRVRANAAKGAWMLGYEGGRAVLAEMLRHRKPEMRLSGLWGLRQIGKSDELELIKDLAKNDPDERVRRSAQMTAYTLEGQV